MILPENYDKLSTSKRRVLRERYIDDQKGNCHYCNGSLKEDAPSGVLVKKVEKNYFPLGFFNNPIHLHHDHVTGLTIGAVHAYCNAVLWQYHGE